LAYQESLYLNISESNFAIWDDTNGVFYEGGQDLDFTGIGSGIELFDPASGLGAVDAKLFGRAVGTVYSIQRFGRSFRLISALPVSNCNS
jgi:hypothetical protein